MQNAVAAVEKSGSGTWTGVDRRQRDLPVSEDRRKNGRLFQLPQSARTVRLALEAGEMVSYPKPALFCAAALTIFWTIIVNAVRIPCAMLMAWTRNLTKNPRLRKSAVRKATRHLWFPAVLRQSPMFNRFFGNAAFADALEVLYRFESEMAGESAEAREIIEWLGGMALSEGVRNRFKIVERQVYEALVAQHLAGVREIELLSVACGGARALFRGIRFFLDSHPHAIVRITLTDMSQKTLDMACEIADGYGLRENIVRTIPATAGRSDWPELFRGQRFHVVEMMGLLDYFNESSAATLLGHIWGLLAPRGTFILANIKPISVGEQLMLSWLFGWTKMVHRTTEQFRKELTAVGFFKATMLEEPYRRYVVAVVHREDDAQA